MTVTLTKEILEDIKVYARDNDLKCETEKEVLYVLGLMTGFASNYS
jgi:hypothetical protein